LHQLDPASWAVRLHESIGSMADARPLPFPAPLQNGNKALPEALGLGGFPLGGQFQSRGFIMFKRTIAIALLSVGLLAVAACNTVEGAGKDVSSAGDAVANAADDAK
jgi:predicted small secreted protein